MLASTRTKVHYLLLLVRETTLRLVLISAFVLVQNSFLLRHSLLRNVSTERRSTVLARGNKRSARYAWRRSCLDIETILWRSERCSLDLVRLVRDSRGFSFPFLLVSLVLYITYLRKPRSSPGNDEARHSRFTAIRDIETSDDEEIKLHLHRT